MNTRRFLFTCPALWLALLVAGCGGGGGGGSNNVPSGLVITSIQVTTQPTGSQSPFGTANGGDTIQIGGSGFVLNLKVFFSGVEAVVLTVGTGAVTCRSPAGAEGAATITVRNPDGATASSGAFQYIAPPVIVSLKATTGPTAEEARAPIDGNETIEVAGQNFKPGIGGSVDGINVVVTFVNSQTIRFQAPATPFEKGATVILSNPEGLSSILNGGLIYTQEFSLAQETRPMTAARARHLFRRAAFGATQAQIDAAVAAGLPGSVDGLVDYVNDPQVERDALAIYGPNPPPGRGFNPNVNKEWWIHLLAENPNGFQERFAYFLHDHFAIADVGFNGDYRWTLHRQIQQLRRFTLSTGQTLDDGSIGLGFDWKRICIEMAKDRAMLDWLDGRLSTARAPNENFARELWELFMLGEGRGYTEDDIKQAARAFTGFRWIRHADGHLDAQYRTGSHDKEDKTLLGVTGKFGYDSVAPFFQGDVSKDTDDADTDGGVVALTLRQRPVEASTFICRKLLEFFLYEGVHDSTVDDLAAELRAPGADQWNLRPIILKVLKSKAMYSSRAMKGKIKNPIEFVFGFLRTTDLQLSTVHATNASRIRGELARIGQVPIDPPDVSGWPTGSAWLSSQAMLERTNFIRFAISQLNQTAQVESLVPAGRSFTARELVDHIAAQLDVRLTGNSQIKLTEYVDEAGPGSFNPGDDTELRKKVRGLLWLIAPYTEGHQD